VNANLRKLAAQWPATRLVEIWNQLPGVKPVTRFTDRDTAIRRIWAVVQDLAPADGASAAASRDLGAKTERVLAADLTAAEFGRMNWVLHRLGPQAIVYPGQHQHTRAAIQSFSGPIRQERVLTHLGWRRQGTQYLASRGPLQSCRVDSSCGSSLRSKRGHLDRRKSRLRLTGV